MKAFKIFVGRAKRTTMVSFEAKYVIDTVRNMIYLEPLIVDSVYTTLRHCEAHLEVLLKSIQLSTAASPKKSHCSYFSTNSEHEDCFVASVLQNALNTNTFQTYPKYAPRNDELKRPSAFMSNQT
jgi:hypothetical protein